MTWDTNSTISRKNEILYHKLSISDKGEYLVHKYFTPQNWPSLYTAYWQHPNEFLNNAFWRLNSDIFLDHSYKGITDPFTKEPAYALFNLLPMFTAAGFQVPIGSSNNTYTFAHLTYTAFRAIGKCSPLVVHYDKKDIPGALDQHIKTAAYYTDALFRWIPYSNEISQSNKEIDVYSAGFIATSIVSAVARTKGSEIANPYAKFAQDLVVNTLTNIVINPLGLNIEGTTLSKMDALKNVLLGINPAEQNNNGILSKISAAFNYVATYAAPVLAVGYQFGKDIADVAAPILTVPYEYGSFILSSAASPVVFIYSKTTEISQTAINYVASPIVKIVMPYVPGIFLKPTDEKISLEQASQKGAIFLVGSITFDIVKFLTTNLVGTLMFIPCSRVAGIFAEEVSELAIDITDSLMETAKALPEYLGYSGETAAHNDTGSEL